MQSFNSARIMKKIVDPNRPFLVKEWDNKPDYGEVEDRPKYKQGRGKIKDVYLG